MPHTMTNVLDFIHILNHLFYFKTDLCYNNEKISLLTEIICY
ncbi:MAG: hypothetical protein K0Q97_2897 [Bacillota bacterium]|jgi:hypothetical protein|nr:hypothetical protein [Bacillota bacterium]